MRARIKAYFNEKFIGQEGELVLFPRRPYDVLVLESDMQPLYVKKEEVVILGEWPFPFVKR